MLGERYRRGSPCEASKESRCTKVPLAREEEKKSLLRGDCCTKVPNCCHSHQKISQSQFSSD